MLDGIEVYYPLEVGCGWVYLCKDGSTYTNMITAVNPAKPAPKIAIGFFVSIFNKKLKFL